MIHPTSLYPGAQALTDDGQLVTLVSWQITSGRESAIAIATIIMPSGKLSTVASWNLNPLASRPPSNPIMQPGARACAGHFAM